MVHSLLAFVLTLAGGAQIASSGPPGKPVPPTYSGQEPAKVTWHTDLELAVEQAKLRKRPLLAVFR